MYSILRVSETFPALRLLENTWSWELFLQVNSSVLKSWACLYEWGQIFWFIYYSFSKVWKCLLKDFVTFHIMINSALQHWPVLSWFCECDLAGVDLSLAGSTNLIIYPCYGILNFEFQLCGEINIMVKNKIYLTILLVLIFLQLKSPDFKP